MIEISDTNYAQIIEEKSFHQVPPEKVFINPKYPPVKVDIFPTHWEFLKKDRNHALSEEYKALDSGQQFRWNDAMKPENKLKNRYANIVAYDHSRVRICTKSSEENDYVNASFIHGYHKKNKYIASQGPNISSLNDFWRIIWEQHVEVIVMVTNLIERSRKKCEQYWPSSGSRQFGDLEVTLKLTDTYSDFIIRTMLLKMKGYKERREIVQFHYLSWPDHCLPTFPADIVNLRHKLRKMFPSEQMQHPVLEQYVFVFRALLEAFTCGITEIAVQDIHLELRNLLKSNQEGTKKNGIQLQYERLQKITLGLEATATYAALKAENKSKNRHLHILPSDDRRVVLSKSAYDEDSDYINAVFVNCHKRRNAFIATQFPLPSTVKDFWYMVVQHRVGVVVLLNTLFEEDQSYKQFWPRLQQTVDYKTFTVSLISEKSGKINELQFEIKSNEDGSVARCMIFYYPYWKNLEVPELPMDIIDLLILVEKQHFKEAGGPITVICSDRASRCGTFIAISNLLENLKLEQIIDVFQTVKKIRSTRPEFVGNLEQYKFCYDVVMAYLDSFSTYSNYGN